jgi:hypothetical protein
MNALKQFPLEMSAVQATIAGKGRGRISSDRSHWTCPVIEATELQAPGLTANPRRSFHRLAFAGSRALSVTRGPELAILAGFAPGGLFDRHHAAHVPRAE